jgi:hypothetical protein
MAKLLTTSGISHHIEEIIKDASKRVVLISPYLRLNEGVRRLIQAKARSAVEVHVLFGKEDLRPQEEAWLRSQPHVRLRFLRNLHAKCYFNESSAIVASMNLHQYSQQNNVEVGVLLSKSEDRVAFSDLIREAEQLLVAADAGACIRCGGTIPRDPMQPFCPRCLAVWQKYENSDYAERFCHICHDPSTTSKRKPVCFDCFQRYATSLVFPGASPSPAPRTRVTRKPSFLARLLERLRS